MSRTVAFILGYAFLGLGVLGLFLPFLQGVLFLVVGLVILSRHAPWAHGALGWLRRRHPVAAATIGRAEAWITRRGRQARVRLGRMLGGRRKPPPH